MTNFSFYNRETIKHTLESEQFDLLIIGGGITGAGIALDAASRGLKAALIEKNDFAFGTSSRSTKLIHGGLRYLKQLEFGLVKEVGSERAIVHRLARHLVIPEKMLLPLSEKKGLGYWLTSIGLMVYDYLAGVKPKDQRRMLSRKRTLRYEPLLKKDDIKGGAIYAEYRTDDARLTIEIIKQAHQHGAVVLNYIKASDFTYKDGKISSVTVIDSLKDNTFSVQAKVVVNATGPWVDDIRSINNSKTGKRLHLTKGVHVVVPHERFPVTQSIYFDVDDGRMIFAIPRGRTTYIGTTDTNYHDSIDEVYADDNDATYIINAVNNTFPGVHLSLNDIESSWAGLRPLIHEEGKSASQLSRKDEIFESPTGLISIAGGKLTGYRKMSERVVNLVMTKYLKLKKNPKTNTANIPVLGGDFKNFKAVRKYILEVRQALKPFNLQEEADYLVHNYGTQTSHILVKIKSDSSNQHPILKLLSAEAIFCIENEMVVTLSDFFIRRTGLVYFNINRVLEFKNQIADVFAQRIRLDEQKTKAQLTELENYIHNIKRFNKND